MNRNITAPLSDEVAKELKSGDYVYITGTIYTARDAAHKRMWEALEKGEELPIEMKNNIIYYMGPSPAREGRPIGSAGPTTASRMDKYAPKLLDLGLKGMIGKGKRSEQVKEAIVRNGSVYFAAVPSTILNTFEMAQPYTIHIAGGVVRNPLVRLARPVTLDFLAGEHIAIVGPNGAGKSLLVDMLTAQH